MKPMLGIVPLFAIVSFVGGCEGGTMPRLGSGFGRASAPACDATSAIEINSKRYLSKLFRSEFWGKCVKIQSTFAGGATPDPSKEGWIIFVGYPGQGPSIESFQFHAPQTQAELLFSHKQGDKMTVIGRVQEVPGGLGDIGGDWIIAEKITFP